jgi:hypothetical protein
MLLFVRTYLNSRLSWAVWSGLLLLIGAACQPMAEDGQSPLGGGSEKLADVLDNRPGLGGRFDGDASSPPSAMSDVELNGGASAVDGTAALRGDADYTPIPGVGEEGDNEFGFGNDVGQSGPTGDHENDGAGCVCGDGICEDWKECHDPVDCPQDCCGGNPSVEVCNGKDDDCDSKTDEDGALGCFPIYKDADQDGVGLAGASRCLCEPEGEYTATGSGDCDDGDEEVIFGSPEICDGADNDCDGETDEDFSVGEPCSDEALNPCHEGVLACNPGDNLSSICIEGSARPAGMTCAPYSCEGGVLTLARICDGAGACMDLGQTPCEPYTCASGGAACRNQCSLEEHCAGGYTCDQSECVSAAP